MITGIMVGLFGLIDLVIDMPISVSNIFMFIATANMTFSVFLISKMNGLEA